MSPTSFASLTGKVRRKGATEDCGALGVEKHYLNTRNIIKSH